MLRLGKMTDYAFIILDVLSEHTERPLSAQAVAALSKLPEPTVSKILKILARADLIYSIRGAGGGYHLSHPINDISVLDVVEAMEGRVTMVECVDSPHTCTVISTCPVQGRWNGINAVLRNTLSDWSLNDLKQGRAA